MEALGQKAHIPPTLPKTEKVAKLQAGFQRETEKLRFARNRA